MQADLLALGGLIRKDNDEEERIERRASGLHSREGWKGCIYLLTCPLFHPPWPKFTPGSVLSLRATGFTGPSGSSWEGKGPPPHAVLHLRPWVASTARDSRPPQV